MKELTFKFLLLATFSGLLFSCTKDDNGPNEPIIKPAKLVKQVISATTDFTLYEYDVEGKVTKHISQWQNGAGINKLTNVFEYDEKKLTKWSNEAGYANYSYTNEVLAKSDHFAFNGKKISSLIYSFNPAGQITEVLEQIANPLPNGPKETRIAYQYYPDGNVSRIDFAHRKELTHPFTINFTKLFVEYDNKINTEPDGVIGNFLPGVILMINNPIKINNVLPNGTIDGYSRYEYTYNEKGYPATRKHFISVNNAEQSPLLFHYIY